MALKLAEMKGQTSHAAREQDCPPGDSCTLWSLSSVRLRVEEEITQQFGDHATTQVWHMDKTAKGAALPGKPGTSFDSTPVPHLRQS